MTPSRQCVRDRCFIAGDIVGVADEVELTAGEDVVTAGEVELTGGEDVVTADEVELTGGEDVVTADEVGLTAGQDVVTADEVGLTAGKDVVAADEVELTAGEDVVTADEVELTAGEDVVTADEVELTAGEDVGVALPPRFLFVGGGDRMRGSFRDSAHGSCHSWNLCSSNFVQLGDRMKRVASISIFVLLLTVPLVAQTSAQGSFNFKGTEGLQTINFDALGDSRSAQGSYSLAGPTLVSDQPDGEDPKQTILVPDFTMKVTVDCMNTVGTRVTMSGTVSDSNVRSVIGRFATLTVEDNDLNPKDPRDRFTFGTYWEKDISWFPSDAEVRGDAGWTMSWWATDAERKDDVGYMITRKRQVDCRSFPVATYDLDPIAEGSITVK